MDNVERFKTLKAQLEQLTSTKIRIDERYKNEREKLDKLVKDISAKGYNPAKLSETKAEKEAELEKVLAELESQVKEITLKLSEVEA